ncbi:MAG TPA: riboflavin synthase [Acidiferrobacteraceae bacterium]|nr:riboflavin synthase [Acidiferrobacteraceae bacterium]
MFTGIIQAVGTLKDLHHTGNDAVMTLDSADLDLSGARIGDSIAVSGVCLTAVSLGDQRFSADLSAETLGRTILGDLSTGQQVNLELALRLQDRLGGHLISGHVDGVGIVSAREDAGQTTELRIRPPGELAHYIAGKGSVAIDGVSLTVNAVDDQEFTLTIIPQTLSHTTLGDYRPGQRVNLEVDLIARYLERIVLGAGNKTTVPAVAADVLKEHGFMDKGKN